MNERQMHDVMTYIGADFDADVKPEKRRVWLDQFGHLDYEVAMCAARVLVSRKTFGAPRAHDFACVVDEITAGREGRETWGEAWDAWILCARKFGSYRIAECKVAFAEVSPMGAAAMGTSADEWFMLPVADVNTFKAQFRQRYEALSERERTERLTSPVVKSAIDKVRARNPQLSAGETAFALLGAIAAGGQK